ncbi:MAG: DUF2085 domain-containing protein [Actinomycetota bacterium]|nr:DUF2085 domain-containing protein [Actinomycetota bacterium]MDP3631317.1 DUF2085 domain-containing protein [Actinomycetota bacterium]
MLRAVFHWVGYGLCHQLPERSLFAGGFQLPVCARDTGIYAGFVLSLVVIALLERGRRPSEIPRPWLVVLGAIFLGTMVADGVSSYAGWRSTTNDLRLITGLLAGYALTLAVVPMLNGEMWRTLSRTRLLEGWRAGVWVISIVPAFALLRWGLPWAGLIYPILLTIAIVVTFAVVNLIFVTLVPFFERRAVHLRDAWPQALIALGVVILELAAAAALRFWLEGVLTR